MSLASWGVILELQSPKRRACHSFFLFLQSDRRKSRHHYESDEKTETRENGVTDDLDAPKPKKAKMREKLNGDTEEGLSRLSDEFSPSHKSRRKDVPNGDVDTYERRSKRVSSLENSTYKSSDKVEEVHTIFTILLMVLSLKCRPAGSFRSVRIDSILFPT